ncbi:MAG: hypothetical protein ACE5HO_18425 [bacterium]
MHCSLCHEPQLVASGDQVCQDCGTAFLLDRY